MKISIWLVLPAVVLGCVGILGCAGPSEEQALTPVETQGATSPLVEPENWWDILPRPGYASLEKVGELGKWFEVYKLLEGTYAIYEPYQFQEAISYLVIGEQRAALVDSGNGIGDIKAVVDELTDLPVTVLLTHEHIDHYGGAHQFEDVAVYNRPSAIERVRGGMEHEEAKRFIEDGYVWKPLPEGLDAERFAIQPIEPTKLLEDGEIIDLGGRRLEVIHTPGHSPGSTSYLDPDHRLLFTGDHFYPGPLYAHTNDVNLKEYVESNDRLAARVDGYDHVLSGHNEPWVEGEVIPRVSQAFRTIFAGGGEFQVDGDLRRYQFDGFDIITREAMIEQMKPR
jgi:glyoxylase-like metal-dependent hydrolase (beta-lactamase superfamily II)